MILVLAAQLQLELLCARKWPGRQMADRAGHLEAPSKAAGSEKARARLSGSFALALEWRGRRVQLTWPSSPKRRSPPPLRRWLRPCAARWRAQSAPRRARSHQQVPTGRLPMMNGAALA